MQCQVAHTPHCTLPLLIIHTSDVWTTVASNSNSNNNIFETVPQLCQLTAPLQLIWSTFCCLVWILDKLSVALFAFGMCLSECLTQWSPLWQFVTRLRLQLAVIYVWTYLYLYIYIHMYLSEGACAIGPCNRKWLKSLPMWLWHQFDAWLGFLNY